MTGSLEQFQALLDDKAFVDEISKMDNNEDVQKAFADRGIGFSTEEIDYAVRTLYEDDVELSEESLEVVSGGFVITGTMVTAVGCVAAGTALFAGVMTEVNNNRKAAGKKPIW